MDSPICIDISHWQDYPDFEAVKAAGVEGVIHKATEGTGYIDPNRAENLSNAKKAGLAIATYHWIKPGDGRAQAEFYLSVVDPVQGERMVIDYEEDGCSINSLEDSVAALLDCGRDLQVTVYSGHLLKQQLGNSCNTFLRDNTDLWLAQYTSDESDISWPDGTYNTWTLWQYSETGEVDGIDDGYVDLNNFNGSKENFLKWMGPVGAKPPKPEPPVPPPVDTSTVDVAISAPENVAVNVMVNGSPARPHRLLKRRQFKRGPDILR